MKLAFRKSEWLDNWWLIERAEHEHRQWDEERPMAGGGVAIYYMDSSRVCDADVEGYAEEMLEIAEAIERRSRASSKRCAVEVMGDGSVHFWSPRNSQEHGVATLAEADELAALIRATLAANASKRGAP